MKLPTLFALGAALVVIHTPVAGQDPAPAAVKEGYFKMRVEVETRGVLKVTDKSAVILTRFRYYDLQEPTKEALASPTYPLELDFARAPELRELAKTLDGKEVVVTGLGELRQMTPPPMAGGVTGFGPPHGFLQSWPSLRFHPPVLVTKIQPVAGKK